MIYICISSVQYFNRKMYRHHYRAKHSTSRAVWYTLRFEPVSTDNCIMHACSTDDICTHATCMLFTITMEMKLFLVPLFYCPCVNTGLFRKGVAEGKNTLINSLCWTRMPFLWCISISMTFQWHLLTILLNFHTFSRPGNQSFKFTTFPGFPWPHEPCVINFHQHPA